MAPLAGILLLALIQGLAEFFPVSSSGHLVVVQRLLHLQAPPLLIGIVLHLGTLAAVVLFFRLDIWRLATRPLQPDNRRWILMIAVASIPTALMGLIFKDFFEGLFSNPFAVGYSFLITAGLLLVSGKLRIPIANPYLAAVIIGIFQGLAIAPGISRSGATIATALILGLGFDFSFRFSFLLSIPAILGATLLEAKALGQFSLQPGPLVAGFVVAFLVGLTALYILRKIMLREKFSLFGWYCLGAGITALILF